MKAFYIFGTIILIGACIYFYNDFHSRHPNAVLAAPTAATTTAAGSAPRGTLHLPQLPQISPGPDAKAWALRTYQARRPYLRTTEAGSTANKFIFFKTFVPPAYEDQVASCTVDSLDQAAKNGTVINRQLTLRPGWRDFLAFVDQVNSQPRDNFTPVQLQQADILETAFWSETEDCIDQLIPTGVYEQAKRDN